MRNHARLHPLSIPLALALATLGCKSIDDTSKEVPDLTRATKPDLKKGQELFEATCTACHTIGKGDSVGPDLHDVHTRRETAWLIRWMKDPEGMAKNDPTGRELFEKYNKVPMPPPGLDDEEIRKVLAYVVAVSKKTPRTASPATQATSGPATKEAAAGQAAPATR